MLRGRGNYLLCLSVGSLGTRVAGKPSTTARCVDFPDEPEYEGGVLTVRQFLAVLAGLAAPALMGGCKRGEPAKTLLLHDSGAARPRRFDDVKILGRRSDYVKFRTASGEVIEFSGRYEIKP